MNKNLLTTADMALLEAVWDEVFGDEPDVEYHNGDERVEAAMWLDGIIAFTRTGDESWSVAYITEEEVEGSDEALISYLEPDDYETFAEALSHAAGLVAIARASEVIEDEGEEDNTDQFIFAGQHAQQVGVA